jgi:hypothetical protein
MLLSGGHVTPATAPTANGVCTTAKLKASPPEAESLSARNGPWVIAKATDMMAAAIVRIG